MKRRDFVKSVFYTTALASSGVGLNLISREAQAAIVADQNVRVLVNIMLLGGADLRFLFVPETGTAYAAKFWEKRKDIYQNLYDTYEQAWNDLYLPTTSNGTTFGIHKNAGWLKEQFDAGNVAIIANVVGSENRRHDHSQLIMHTGDLDTDQFVYDRNGWGGRLADVMGAQANVVAVSHDVSPFCNSVNPSNRLEQVVHIRDSRNFALAGANGNATSERSVLARALKSYYAQRGTDVDDKILQGELPENWPFRRFFNHERTLRNFGDRVKERVETVKPAQPYRLSRLYKTGSYRLNNSSFGKQCANLYDSLLASDILKLRLAYLEYSSWDTHRNEKIALEKNLHDIFGFDGGLDALTDELEVYTGTNENLVYVFTSDFGRQLAANGDRGTDHGRGTYTIVIGRSVRGGVYGEMFPKREILPDPNDTQTPQRAPYDQLGADINGLTSFEHALSAISDWVEPGSGVAVFPNMDPNNPTPPKLEPGVSMRALFQPGYGISGKMLLNGYTLPDFEFNLAAGDAIGRAIKTNQYGKFWIDGMSDGTHLIQPYKPYFTFDPPLIKVSVLGGDVYDIDFNATTVLHFTQAFRSAKTYPLNEVDHRVILAYGYNFVPAQTKVTIGGTPIDVAYSFGYQLLVVWVPLSVTAGDIVVATPTEKYTHTIPYEDLEISTTF
jgi:uncharacterized protein (DUF1501 family)